MLVCIGFLGLAVAYIIGTFQIYSESGVDIHRRYNQVPLAISAMAFGLVIMVFIFIEHWSQVLAFMIELTGTRTPTAGTLLSPWVIFFISVLYAVVAYDIGRVASALKIQKIIERRWAIRSQDSDPEE